MKRNIIQFMVIGAMATAMLASCNKNKETEANVPENGFLATVEGNHGNGGRTHLDGNDVLWNADDQIVVRNGNGDAATYTLTDGEGTTSGTFYSGEDGGDFFQPSYTAIYPAAEGNTLTGEGAATFTLPATQTYLANSFANGAMPMMAVSDEQTLEFKNALGGICFPMTGSQTVTRLVLTSNSADDNLSGVFAANYNNGEPTLTCTTGSGNSITLDCGAGVALDATTATDFTIMVPAGSLANGFKLEAYNGEEKIFEKTNDTNLGESFIPRSVIRKVNSNLEVGEVTGNPLTFEAKAAGSTVTFTAVDITPAITMEYSTDGETWNEYTSGTAITLANVGDKVMFRGDNATLNFNYNPSYYYYYSNFSCTGECYLYGNVMSLLDKEATSTSVPACAFFGLFYYNQAIYNHPEHPIELPATTLADYCYSEMFYGCTSLTTAPELPATTLASYCYWEMFCVCESLTTAPELPATTLADHCYDAMFGCCTSLTTAPELPATTLADGCYHGMFHDCTSLTTAPELPATTLADECYTVMFGGCTSLTTAPELPATTLADFCYENMFLSCTSLTTAPELPATTLADFCYREMFSGCTSLTTAPELPATTLATECYGLMFNGCTSLTTAPELPATTLADYCYGGMFLGCTSLTTAPELPATTLADYCYNGMFYGCTSLTTAPELPATTLAEYCYYGMFNGCTSLTTAPELPATTLAEYCYREMFRDCTSLTTAPELPATTLAGHCYEEMFMGCYSLTTAPELPATTLADYCYSEMFRVCTSLTTAPELPATTLADYCYSEMFDNCTSLTTAPELPATTLADYCYYHMFYNCHNLNYIKCLATDISASNCTSRWVYGVSSTGTFVKHPSMTGWSTGPNRIPSGWTVLDASL